MNPVGPKFAWLVSGLLCGSAYLFIPNSPLPLLAWVGLVPLLLRLASVPSFGRFYLEALAMLWVMELMTLGRVFNIDPVFSLGVVTGQALTTSVVFVVLWLLRKALGWRTALLSLPACWTAWEWLYAKQPLQIPTFLGATQSDFYPLIQFYEVTGVWGGTFCIVLCNAWVTLALQKERSGNSGPWTAARAGLAPVGLVCALPLAYSAWAFNSAPIDITASTIRVAMVQTGNPHNPAVATVTLAARLSEPVLLDKPDLLIWPETALVRDMASADNRKLWDSLYAWVAHHALPVLTGITDVEVNANAAFHPDHWNQKDAYFNAAALITPQFAYYALTLPEEQTIAAEVYRKRILFPFGERVPFVETFPALHTLVMHTPDQPPRNFSPGDQPVVFAFLDRKGTKRLVGAFICYEILFPQLPADLVRSGAEILATVSNDVHLNDHARWVTAAHSRIRAIETRRSVARVNTVGYSLFVDAFGRVEFVAPLDNSGAWTRPLELRTDQTLYVRWGDWLPMACAAATLMVAIFAAVRATGGVERSSGSRSKILYSAIEIGATPALSTA